ncbi:hypothetical protein [Streptococcus sp. 151470009-6]|jgi:hypothetical protein
MKANQLKPSQELAYVVIGDYSPIVTESARTMYEYVNNERTDRIKSYTTELVLTNQNFEKVRCITPDMPRVFLGGDLEGAVKVELVNPIAAITYNNEIRLFAQDIVLAEDDEVAL